MISQKLVAGDTLSYLQDAPTGADGAYYPGDGWTLKYRLIPRDGTASVIDLTATTEGTQYRVAAAATVTDDWSPGDYSVAAWVEKGAEVYTVEPAFSQLVILQNPRTAVAGFDGRTLAQKAIDDLNVALASYTASNGTIAEYEIAGRRMKFTTSQGIRDLLRHWQTERAREIRKDAIARGMADPRFSYVRFDGHGS
jgi:hypothetical protein